jgi:hypothetical protein
MKSKNRSKVVTHCPPAEIESLYSHPAALKKAHLRYGGAEGLLRSAAASIESARTDHHGQGESQSDFDEASQLRLFLEDNSLLLQAGEVEQFHEAHRMTGGSEHRVAFMPPDHVIKIADAGALATASLYDYLTDLMLSNHCFGDRIALLGAYVANERFRLVICQPYVSGKHPDWVKLKTGLVRQGLEDLYPASKGGNFVITDSIVGALDVYDLHVNNVICDASGWLHPIDAHFYFSDRVARSMALSALGFVTARQPLPQLL